MEKVLYERKILKEILCFANVCRKKNKKSDFFIEKRMFALENIMMESILFGQFL